MSAADIRAIQAQGVREIIVKRDPGLSPAQQAALRSQAGVSYVGPGPLANTELDRAPAGALAAAVNRLEREPQVQYAEPNGEVHAAGTPNDPYFSQQWALSNTGQAVNGTAGTPGDDIGAMYAWPHSTGSGVTVAVIDTGADSTAPDLQGQLVTGASFINGVQGTDTADQNGHGTHVSGIIAAAQNNGIGVSGVAPSATVIPLRALDASGQGTLDDVAAAFNYAGDHNVPIVNASLGGNAPSQTLENAVAAHPNTLYVVAAGNDGANNDTTSFYPCDLPEANLICVGASDQNDQPAWFSNYGAGNVDLFAPGVNILSTWIAGANGTAQYAYADGTSMATPMVSGTLALMLAHNSSLSAAQLKRDLLASVDQEPQLAGLSAAGGELDTAAAVATAGGDPPYAPPGNTARPAVSGATTVGTTLTATAGSWSRGPTSFSYQWQRCRLGVCVPVPGATGSSYTLIAGDAGASIDVVVGATNSAGFSQAASAQTQTVQSPGSSSSGPASPPPASAGSSGSVPPGPLPTVQPPPVPRHRAGVNLTHVALVGRRQGQAVVFTLSGRTRVQIALSPTARRGAAASDVLRLTINGRKGTNRCALSALLGGHRLAAGRYALTVRAGNRAVTLRLALA
jgi:thermitase